MTLSRGTQIGAGIDKRVTAEIKGQFVLTGMRINRRWKPWKWGPTATAMPKEAVPC